MRAKKRRYRGPDKGKRRPRGVVAPAKPEPPVAYSLRAAECLFIPPITKRALILAIKSGRLKRRLLGNRHVITHEALVEFANSLPEVSRKAEIIE